MFSTKLNKLRALPIAMLLALTAFAVNGLMADVAGAKEVFAEQAFAVRQRPCLGFRSLQPGTVGSGLGRGEHADRADIAIARKT